MNSGPSEFTMALNMGKMGLVSVAHSMDLNPPISHCCLQYFLVWFLIYDFCLDFVNTFWYGIFMEKRSKRRISKRLTREKWLSLAMEAIARRGGAKLRIEQLVRNLGVSKGSFYWHFKDRDDFVRSLVDYWASYSTSQVIEAVNRVGGDAKKRLYAVLEKVIREDLGRYDLAIRAWAALEPAVARVVAKVDAQRLSYVRALFSEMSFRGQELELRARALVCYMAGEHVFYARESKKEQIRKLKQKHTFFTRP